MRRGGAGKAGPSRSASRSPQPPPPPEFLQTFLPGGKERKKREVSPVAKERKEGLLRPQGLFAFRLARLGRIRPGFRPLEFRLDLLAGCRGQQGYDEDGQAAEDEGGE